MVSQRVWEWGAGEGKEGGCRAVSPATPGGTDQPQAPPPNSIMGHPQSLAGGPQGAGKDLGLLLSPCSCKDAWSASASREPHLECPLCNSQWPACPRTKWQKERRWRGHGGWQACLASVGPDKGLRGLSAGNCVFLWGPLRACQRELPTEEAAVRETARRCHRYSETRVPAPFRNAGTAAILSGNMQGAWQGRLLLLLWPLPLPSHDARSPRGRARICCE